MLEQGKFTIRIYGLIFNNDKKEILLSDEFMLDMKMTKFPGGGLEFGEGTIDCIKREAMEEFGQPVRVLHHFYTTDYYQKALFYPNHQLISIYYVVEFTDPIQFKISKEPFDFEMINGNQSFRWEPISVLSPEDLTFPVDRKVMGMIKEKML